MCSQVDHISLPAEKRNDLSASMRQYVGEEPTVDVVNHIGAET